LHESDRLPPATGHHAGVAAEDLFRRIVEILDGARRRVARAVNSTMVQTYWEIGRQIVQVEQAGEQRAEYGEQVLAQLSERLTRRFGRSFSLPNLKRMRRFYLVYSSSPRNAPGLIDNRDQLISSALLSQFPPATQPTFRLELGWTQYLMLMTVANPSARSFYEIEAASQGWSSRELERQIASHLFERLAASRDKDEVLALARQGQEVLTPQDVVKDPVVLEFLGLAERPH
jgi:hypothetical protein